MPKTALLTGISGFIGLHCAKELLKCGFKVRGTIRNPNKKKVVCDSLKLNEEEAKRIEFFLLDLTSDHGWEVAMRDSTFVMHVASPFRIANPKNANDFFKPAIEGTERVLRHAQHAGVRRVILTSSIVSMMSNLKTGQFSPNDWTDLSRRNLSTYIKSKTLSERLAWDFVNKEEKTNQNKQRMLELAVIAPGGVFGPPLGKDFSAESLYVMTKMLRENATCSGYCYSNG